MIHQETGLWWLNTQFKEKRGFRTRLLIPPSSPTTIPKRPPHPRQQAIYSAPATCWTRLGTCDLGLLTPFNS